MRSRRIAASVVAGVLSTVAVGTPALAAAPTLLSVTQADRHPLANFSIPGADDATIYFASRPDRSTDGSFLAENIVDSDFLSDDEIAGGRWSYEDQLDPGLYYVMLRASDYDCDSVSDPGCLDGFSAIVPLTIPKPIQRFTRKVSVYRYLGLVDLELTARPLGEKLPYRVCWTQKNGRRKCLRSTIDGYSWNSDASDSLSVRMRGMRSRTMFTWYVQGRKVASKRVRTVRA